MGVIHQPHSINTKIKRVSRLVILPDYQGIGLGTKFLNEMAKYYSKQGYDFSIISSAKNLIGALKKDSKWCLYSYQKSKKSKTGKIDSLRETRNDVYTARFMYKKR